jgi:hypothetical protein
MYMYKLEIETSDGVVYLIVIAETDEKAFDYVEGLLVRHFTVSPEVKSETIIEKKRVSAGSGYVIESALFG